MKLLEIIGYGVISCYYVVLVFICWKIWRFSKNRKWKNSALLSLGLLVVVVFPGLSWGMLPGSSIYGDLIQTWQLTGHSFILGKPKLFYHPERCFNGDGYSIDIYSFSEHEASVLANPSTRFFNRFPIRPSYRRDWKSTSWQKTPSRPQDAEFIEFVHLANKTGECDPMNPQDVAARLLTEEGNFYSYFYNWSFGHPADVDLFIISPKKRIFVIANQNT
jgi:hypothetical protein